MSIKPIDYTSLVPKSQEVTKIKQVENERYKNQIQIGFEQQQKLVKQNIKKVRNTNKTENLIIDKKKENKKKKNKDKENKDKKRKETIGGNIDIKI